MESSRVMDVRKGDLRGEDDVGEDDGGGVWGLLGGVIIVRDWMLLEDWVGVVVVLGWSGETTVGMDAVFSLSSL